MPGYNCYSGENDSPHRGGCAVLIKSNLVNQIAEMDLSYADQIRIKMKCLPKVTLVGCYIPPADSPYFSLNAFASLQTLTKCHDSGSIILLGDLNTRFGTEASRFIDGKDDNIDFTYVESSDPINTPNCNARHAITALQPLLLLNNLKKGGKVFKGALTYRQGNKFISELDMCFVSPEILDYVCEFSVDQALNLPSNHAPISIALDFKKTAPDISHLLSRAAELGTHATSTDKGSERSMKRQINMRNIDSSKFIELIHEIEPPIIRPQDDVDTVIDHVNKILYTKASEARTRDNHRSHRHQNGSRWETLVADNDNKRIWNAIDWTGKVNSTQKDVMPSDQEFKVHFEKLLNPGDAQPIDVTYINEAPYIPITDDPFTPMEIQEAIKMTRGNKSGGVSGISPGVLKLLPVNWILFLTSLFTWIFNTGSYPQTWRESRLVTIFKKGMSNICDNYRGISIMDYIGKLYDTVLCLRLQKWFKPDREQAGAQSGRGCLEHIVSLRLLIDYAVSKRCKLFIIFVDFSKAYDRVLRNILIQVMKGLGCGMAMLMAIATTYSSTQLVLGAATITAAIGVRQGSPTSCFLFTLYVNGLIRALKAKCAPDGFLGWLHSLVLMDDTVILATTRETAQQKMEVLLEFCNASGMVLNGNKTKFMVINGTDKDRRSFMVKDKKIQNCDSYIYLGSTFTEDGKIQSAIKKHCKLKASHVLKFQAFMQKNCDFPFWVKRTVLDAALLSSIFYGCESWLCNQFKEPHQQYMASIKALLGVRITTPNDICLIELGYPTIAGYIRSVQYRFYAKIVKEREGMSDDPFNTIWELVRTSNTPCAKYILQLLSFQEDPKSSELNKIKERIMHSQSTKSVTYLNYMNPDLQVHKVYINRLPEIPEHCRMAFTRMRVSAHNLAIEKGRWSRVPREQRLCPCGNVQTERHVIAACAITDHIRDRYSDVETFQLPEFFNNRNVSEQCKVCYECLATF